MQKLQRKPISLSESGIKPTINPLAAQGKVFCVGNIEDRNKFAESHYCTSLVATYREVFGRVIPLGWGEYLKCSDSDCTKTYSIEDIFPNGNNKNLHELEKNIKELPKCTQCGKETELFYEPEILMQEIRKELQKRFYGALAFSKDDVQSFAYGWISTPKEIWQEKFAKFYQFSRLTYEEFLRQIEQNSNGKISESTQMYYGAEAGNISTARKIGLFPSVMKSILQNLLQVYGDIKCIFSTAKNSPMYGLKKLGAQTICKADDYDLEVICADTYKIARIFKLSS